MCQTTILRAQSRFYVYSWTNGVQQVRLPQARSDDDVLALALWLVRRGYADEADALLEQHCSR